MSLWIAMVGKSSQWWINISIEHQYNELYFIRFKMLRTEIIYSTIKIIHKYGMHTFEKASMIILKPSHCILWVFACACFSYTSGVPRYYSICTDENIFFFVMVCLAAPFFEGFISNASGVSTSVAERNAV